MTKVNVTMNDHSITQSIDYYSPQMIAKEYRSVSMFELQIVLVCRS